MFFQNNNKREFFLSPNKIYFPPNVLDPTTNRTNGGTVLVDNKRPTRSPFGTPERHLFGKEAGKFRVITTVQCFVLVAPFCFLFPLMGSRMSVSIPFRIRFRKGLWDGRTLAVDRGELNMQKFSNKQLVAWKKRWFQNYIMVGWLN